FSWMPDVTVWGSFELKVTGTSGSQSSIKYLAIAVRPNYVTTNLIGAWDAQFADSTQSVTGNFLSWKDLSGNSNHGSISNSSNASWSGSGTASSPYAINFNGSGSVDFGTTGSSSTKMMFSGWVNPSNTNSSSESVIIGNSGNATGNGFTVRQKPSYRDVVMSLNPVGYWRLGESSGTTAVDLGSGGNNGTYTNGPTLAQAGGLTSDEDKAASFDGVNDYVISSANSSLSGDFTASIAAWVKFNDVNSGWHSIAAIQSSSDGSQGFAIFQGQPGAGALIAGFYGARYGSTAIGTVATGQWYHVVITKTAGAIGAATSKLYLNGELKSLTFNSGATPNLPSDAKFYIGSDASNEISNSVLVDEVAYFTTALTQAQVSSLFETGMNGRKLDFVIGKSYQDVLLAESPAGYWPLNETTGSTLKDISGLGNNGSYIGSPTLGLSGPIVGETSKSIGLNGVNQYGSIPHTPILDPSASWTMEAWIKRDVLGHHDSILEKYDWVAGKGGFTLRVATNNRMEAHVVSGLSSQFCTSSSTIAINTWYHLAAIFNNSTATLSCFVNGVLESTTNSIATPTLPTTVSLKIGNRGDGSSGFFQGAIAQAALFGQALSSAQILTHYNAGIGTYGGTCTSTSGFSTSAWNFISGLFDGSTASFYVNGRQECTVSSVPQKLSSASTNLTAGSTSTGTKGWLGYLADLLLYRTSDGSVVATAANVKTNFDATADRYRQTPVGNIVTSGLVLNLDAANAKQGLRPFANGCASTDLNWFDLSSSALTGVLTSFASCGASSGWTGTGVAATPYAMTFDGADDYVDMGSTATLKNLASSSFTISAWVNSVLDSTNRSIFGTSWISPGYHIRITSSNTMRGIVLSGGSDYKFSDTAVLPSGWHFVTATWDGTNIVTYLNGSASSTLGSQGTLSTLNSTQNALVGKVSDGGSTFKGGIGSVYVYNRVLTPSEIIQNCNAHKARYSGSSCP
ncbi:MAG: LamG domain-containing protein, partial [Proteobacteria bacterium]|nr:LamG domain-containing protein [Pseudomonadota bacterium]